MAAASLASILTGGDDSGVASCSAKKKLDSMEACLQTILEGAADPFLRREVYFIISVCGFFVVAWPCLVVLLCYVLR